MSASSRETLRWVQGEVLGTFLLVFFGCSAVATAVALGGPGAIFWMWTLAFFGMMSKTAEITLGVHYRVTGPDGARQGGPMHTIRRGLGGDRRDSA